MTGDPYLTLGVAPDADFVSIQTAYRRLMREHHPDRGGGVADEHRARDLNAAFAVLKDPDRRARFDSTRMSSGAARRPEPARMYHRQPLVRRRGPSLEARQRRLQRIRWFKRGLLAGACVLVGLGAAGAMMNYRPSEAPWRTASAEAADRALTTSRAALQDRVG